MTHLYLIRHAQANGLKAGTAGSMVPNSGLSPLGIKQAERLRNRLASTGEIKADMQWCLSAYNDHTHLSSSDVPFR
jgi:probable phosphoglycerate mutase